MAFENRFRSLPVTLTRTGTGSVVGRVSGPFRYLKCSSFRAKVTSSGATSQIELKDANGDIFYKDAADKDYQTATINRVFTQDETTTGLGITPTDATGAVPVTVTQSVPEPILDNPITVTWADADGAAGTLFLELLCEFNPPPGFRKRIVTLTRTATGNVTATVGLGGAQYFRCNNFRALDTGPTNSILELKDKSGAIFYLDAATKDYHTAEVTRVFTRDDTATGLGLSPADTTGAALGVAQEMATSPVLEAPISVRWNNATDTVGTLRLELMVEV